MPLSAACSSINAKSRCASTLFSRIIGRRGPKHGVSDILSLFTSRQIQDTEHTALHMKSTAADRQDTRVASGLWRGQTGTSRWFVSSHDNADGIMRQWLDNTQLFLFQGFPAVKVHIKLRVSWPPSLGMAGRAAVGTCLLRTACVLTIFS